MTEETILQTEKDQLRKGLSKYTRKAFHMLPELDKPRILDIGCGSGVPTIELARLSNGQIIGLDINQPLLDRLTKKVENAGLSDRVKTRKCAMFDMDFPDEIFDIIWAEGSIYMISFKRGLKEWRRLLKPNGFLVVHDEIGDLEEKLKQVSRCGYSLIGHFTLLEDSWWSEYYGPLEKRIDEIRTRIADDSKALLTLDNEQQEIDMFKEDPRSQCSVFFVMKKR